jgi:hypothetical protein
MDFSCTDIVKHILETRKDVEAHLDLGLWLYCVKLKGFNTTVCCQALKELPV